MPVKALLRNLLANPDAIARFRREAAVMSELRHPNIVQVIDFNVTDEQQPYFVMEYLEGRDLGSELEARGALPLHETVSIVGAIASALGTAHRRGIVHRDLKPSNVFLCSVEGWDQPLVKVLDFGISKVRAGGRITNGLNIVGTPNYMAPEQAAGRTDEVDGRTDEFSLAAMAYEMLTGQDAFVGDDQVSLLYQIVHENPPPLEQFVSWPTAGVQEVLSRALSKAPVHRYRTITQFSGALADAARDIRSETVAVPAETALGVPTPAEPEAGNTHAEAADAYATIDVDVEPVPDASTADLRVPRTRYGAVALALIALSLGGVVIKKGWVRELPDDVVITYRSLQARLTGAPPLLQPDRSEPAPPPLSNPHPLPAELTATDRRESQRVGP